MNKFLRTALAATATTAAIAPIMLLSAGAASAAPPADSYITSTATAIVGHVTAGSTALYCDLVPGSGSLAYGYQNIAAGASAVITVPVTPGTYPNASLTCYEPGIAHPSTVEAAPVPPTFSSGIQDTFQGLGLS